MNAAIVWAADQSWDNQVYAIYDEDDTVLYPVFLTENWRHD
jgi:hypothetical protein